MLATTIPSRTNMLTAATHPQLSPFSSYRQTVPQLLALPEHCHMCEPARQSTRIECSAIAEPDPPSEFRVQWLTPLRTRLLVACLLAVQLVGALVLVVRSSATRNEPAHLAAGLALWHQSDPWVYCVNPPLARLLIAAPVVLDATISTQALSRARSKGGREEFRLGFALSQENRAHFHRYIVLARIAGLGWMLVGGVLLYRFASELFGRVAGVVATGLWTTDPMVLAHGSLATPDVPATVLFLATVYLTHRCMFCHRRARCAMILSVAVMTGAAVATKFTAVLLLPLFSIMLAWKLISPGRHLLLSLLELTASLCLYMFVVVIVCWAVYGFDGFGTKIGVMQVNSHLGSAIVTAFSQLALFEHLPAPLPPAMIVGLDLQQCDFEGQQDSYVRGMMDDSGWWWFYLYAMSVKCTEGTLVLSVLAAASMLVWRGGASRAAWMLTTLPLALVFCTASAKSGFTNHLRYVLPCFPFVFLMVASLFRPAMQQALGKALRSLLLTTLVASGAAAALVFPNSLGYFNTMSGGVATGWWHLGDSNVDWGQDIIRLRDWIDSQPSGTGVAVEISHYIDLNCYLAGRTVRHAEADYIVLDAASLVLIDHKEPVVEGCVQRIGASLFVFARRP